MSFTRLVKEALRNRQTGLGLLKGVLVREEGWLGRFYSSSERSKKTRVTGSVALLLEEFAEKFQRLMVFT